jgi:hypothetical protein
MNIENFWSLIDQSCEAADGDPEVQREHLTTLLRELPPDEIVSFSRHFSELNEQAYTWALWGAAYVIGGGCSDDGFLDFREWLITRGKDVYEKALSHPDDLAQFVSEDDECRLGGFWYLPIQVWAEVTGEDESNFPDHDIDFVEDPVGTEWTDDELGGLFPQLSKKFG